MFTLINHAQAASSAQIAAQCFVDKINNVILFPLITLLMALAFLMFLYGAFEYVKNSGSDAGRETGRRHLLYGVIGMLVMLSALAILNIAAGTFGLGLSTVQCSQQTTAQNTALSTNPGPGFGSFDAGGGTGSGFPSGASDPDSTIARPGGALQPPELEVPDNPQIDDTNPCSPATPLLVDGVCKAAPIVDLTNDPTLTQIGYASVQNKIDEEIAAGLYQSAAEWYDPSAAVDMATRVDLINNVWPERCENRGNEYVYRFVDDGYYGTYICAVK